MPGYLDLQDHFVTKLTGASGSGFIHAMMLRSQLLRLLVGIMTGHHRLYAG